MTGASGMDANIAGGNDGMVREMEGGASGIGAIFGGDSLEKEHGPSGIDAGVEIGGNQRIISEDAPDKGAGGNKGTCDGGNDSRADNEEDEWNAPCTERGKCDVDAAGARGVFPNVGEAGWSIGGGAEGFSALCEWTSTSETSMLLQRWPRISSPKF